MKYNQIEATYICQLNKPENRKMLEGYKARRDKSGKELAQYYRDLFKALENTPAFGVSGVNKMLNDLTEKVRATAAKAKRGKVSAFAHAGWLLSQLDFFGETECTARYCGRYKLAPVLSEAELAQLEVI